VGIGEELGWGHRESCSREEREVPLSRKSQKNREKKGEGAVGKARQKQKYPYCSESGGLSMCNALPFTGKKGRIVVEREKREKKKSFIKKAKKGKRVGVTSSHTPGEIRVVRTHLQQKGALPGKVNFC